MTHAGFAKVFSSEYAHRGMLPNVIVVAVAEGGPEFILNGFKRGDDYGRITRSMPASWRPSDPRGGFLPCGMASRWTGPDMSSRLPRLALTEQPTGPHSWLVGALHGDGGRGHGAAATRGVGAGRRCFRWADGAAGLRAWCTGSSHNGCGALGRRGGDRGGDRRGHRRTRSALRRGEGRLDHRSRVDRAANAVGVAWRALRVDAAAALALVREGTQPPPPSWPRWPPEYTTWYARSSLKPGGTSINGFAMTVIDDEAPDLPAYLCRILARLERACAAVRAHDTGK